MSTKATKMNARHAILRHFGAGCGGWTEMEALGGIGLDFDGIPSRSPIL